MKQRNRDKRLAARREAYDNNSKMSGRPGNGYKRPGSLNK